MLWIPINKEVLLSSSSGGAFSALADYVLKNNGIVFGASKKIDTHEIFHIAVSDAKELDKLKLSKYYQSNTSDVFSTVENYLHDGRLVLFTGTACQIAGLYSFLGEKSVDNLITMDVLCHGVPSKKVIDAYIESQEKRFKKKVVDFSFRIKEGEMGWRKGTRMKLKFSDDTEHVAVSKYDTFFIGFNNNFFLRESCYNCKYCGTERVADFTFADFWGCTEIVSPEQLWNGVSLMLFNSEKTRSLMKELNERMEIYSIDPEIAIRRNLALTKPQPRPEYRNVFFSNMERYGFDKSIKKKLWRRFLKNRVKDFLKKVLPRSIAAKIMKDI